nr:Ig-like domain-containing protein [Marinicella sp. NBU2979]
MANAFFTLDDTPPAAAVCVVSPNPANDGTALTATCTGVETGATVSIPNYVCGAEAGNQVICTATAGAGGVTGDETATTTDTAGNSATSNVPFTLDNTPPAVPVCTVTPDPANNGTALTATCTGVETGATLTIPGYVCGAEAGNAVICTATAGQNGVDGDEQATVTDQAGNASVADAFFTLDNTPPTAAVCVVSPNPANDGTALTATCTGVETGATVSIPNYVCGAEAGNQVICNATAGAGGVTGDETATTTDTAGNSATSNVPFTLDNTPPTIGTCTVTPDPANNGTVVTANCTGVEAGATLTIPGYVCSDGGGGNWSCTGTVGVSGVDGDETATATDAAGNTATTPANFTLDNTPPAVPVCTVSPDPANNGTALTATCTGVETGATLTIPGYVCGAETGNEVTCTATAGQNGVDGDEQATVTDDAGNTSVADAFFTLDNTPPAVPVCTVSPDPANNGTALTATCTGVETGATVTIPGYVCGAEAGNEVTCTATAGQNGVDGDEQATVTDAAGNASVADASFILDNTPPAAAVCVVSPNPANDGTALTATCTGVETGATVSIPNYVCGAEAGNQVTCTATAGAGGVTGDETATTTDTAGNSATSNVPFTLDNTPPAVPVCTVTPDPANNGTALTATCTGVESDAVVTIPGYVCGAESGNEVTCTATAGQNGVDGDEQATVTDQAGNASVADAFFTLDNTPPTIGTCTVTPDPANNGTALTATCTGVETDAVVTIPGYVCGAESGNQVICTATAGQNGVDGDETATATDAAGNTATTPAPFVLDNVAPPAPVINAPTNGDPVTGTGEPGATVTVTTPSGATCTAVVQLDGTWSCSLFPTPVDGEDITATQEDEAGNTSPPTTVVGGIDLTAPSAPVINPVVENTDPITGTAEPFTVINLTGVSCDNDPVITNASGVWTCVTSTSLPLTPGDLIVATATDAAGNVSQPASTTVGNSATQSVAPTVNPVPNGATEITGTAVPGSTIDVDGITCSNAPVTANASGDWICLSPNPVPVTDDIIMVTATQSGLLESPPVSTTVYDPGTTAPPAPQVNPTDGDPVSGTTIPNGDITVLDDLGNVLCTTTADAAGNFSCSPVFPLPAHNDVLSVIVTDSNGNSSLPTQVVVDSQAPTAPVCTVSPDPANTGTALTATCTGVETDATVTIPGYVCGAEAGNEVTCTATAGQNGVDGDEQATITDIVGNSNTADVFFTLDDTPPAVPVCTVVPDPASTGTALTATCTGVETDAVVTIPGYVCGAEAGNEVVCTATAGQNGVDGDEQATITDLAGNASNANVFFTLDDTPPVAGAITSISDDTGVSNTDFITNDNTLLINGTAEAGASVEVFVDGLSIGTTTADGSGNWTFDYTGTTLVDGDYDFSVVVTDGAGNVSPPSADQTVRIDTVAPTAASITSVSDDNGVSNNDFITNDNTLLINGTAESGATVEVFLDGLSIGTTTADGTGAWTFDYTGTVLANGDYVLTAGVTDAAGNAGPASAPQALTIDASAPAAPVCVVSPDPASTGTALTATCTGVETDAVVTIPGYVCGAESGNEVTCTATAGQNGVDGDEQATITDVAGNSNNADAFFTLDDTPPAAPVCVVTPNPANDGTALTATCTGVETDATVTIPNYVCGTESGNQVICTGTAGPGGVTGDETATITDLAGNNNTTIVAFTLDNTPPVAPVCIVSPNPANDGTALTATCTGVESNATVTIPNYVCGTEAGNQVICTGTAGPGGVTGDETATITDLAGNSNTTIAAFTLDNVAPATPIITAPVDGTTINDATPLVVGTGEPDAIITVTGPSGESCTTTVDVSGNWSCTLSPALADGSNLITAIAADEAGNESGTDSVTVTIIAGQAYDLLINAPAELVTTEMGGTDTFEVSLPLTPTANVTVNFSSSDLTEGTVAPGSVTFTPSNWDQPVTITVTGVDDVDYDLDQNYQIITSALSSGDSNYDGVNPVDLDAVNIDDDESPNLTAFITNCVAGVQPDEAMLYELYITNTGNKDIVGATVTTVMGNQVSTPTWVCQGVNCDATSGSNDINQTVDLPVGAEIVYLIDTNVTGPLMSFIDVEGAVAMPVSETDVDPSDNVAFDSDLIYQFIFKNSFECVAPGTVQSTKALFDSLQK